MVGTPGYRILESLQEADLLEAEAKYQKICEALEMTFHGIVSKPSIRIILERWGVYIYVAPILESQGFKIMPLTNAQSVFEYSKGFYRRKLKNEYGVSTIVDSGTRKPILAFVVKGNPTSSKNFMGASGAAREILMGLQGAWSGFYR